MGLKGQASAVLVVVLNWMITVKTTTNYTRQMVQKAQKDSTINQRLAEQKKTSCGLEAVKAVEVLPW